MGRGTEREERGMYIGRSVSERRERETKIRTMFREHWERETNSKLRFRTMGEREPKLENCSGTGIHFRFPFRSLPISAPNHRLKNFNTIGLAHL